jgi:hypothetical protein
MVYQNPYPWYFALPNPWYSKHPLHGIVNTLSMVFWSPNPRYIEHPSHVISKPLSMLTLTLGILTCLPLVYRTPYP